MSHTPHSPLRRLLAGGLFATFAALLLPGSLAHAEPSKTLRIGYQKFNSINILKGSGALEKALAPQGVSVSWYEFAAGPQLLEALSTGAIDLGHAADAPSVFAQAAGKPVVYLAAEQPYPKGIGLVVREQDKIASVAALKGQRVATGRGWNAQYLLAVALQDAGLSYKDITPAYVNNAADAVAALQSGSVQAVTLWDPFLAAAEKQPGLKNLRDGSGLSNNRTFYLSSAAFADNNRALLKTFFSELAKVSSWANQQPDEVAALLAPQLGIGADVLQVASERRNYNAVAIDAQITAEQQKLADTFQGLGLIPKPLKVADAVYPVSVLP
ncbi:aliphatic sulfonate ABC transporter substrate-binding protein [Pseudomonas donghuensis]|uniref:Aliphatic sulfonate ABC transporter substrate-binding protein n=1 Tax=Pseudomonas donghuensis TaxID=1163398 RepID=A0AAP0SD60_9PSED|nr:aliphatic sulfonate ABC transporter substrate-binding protein [Pseudomonas donghuensis]KDN98303.1 aliphatic sulfonate ABC transporter substrate-binding protein [Pseudomonas donghuensis]MCP6692161.1 aliphatic sulfonate ABC transporter substrate-binding protein [Pseudomonas donghuensis]MDF9894253.1 sulfonate transport system substrate-binding protein [Pseudomonas vranovensis]